MSQPLPLQRLADRLVESGKVPSVVVGLIAADGTTHAAAAGHRDPARDAPMALDTPYFLASISKMYTTATILQLVEEGRIGFEVPMTNYLPAGLTEGVHVLADVDHTPTITVAQLLNQTSGIGDYFEGKPRGGSSLLDELLAGHDRAFGIEDILDMARSVGPTGPPGERASYSDTNFALLGAIVEHFTGGSLSDAFAARIFGPLGLENTWLYRHDSGHDEPATMFHGDQPVVLPLAMSSMGPDGGVVATVSDSLGFLDGFFEGRLFSKAGLQKLLQPWNRIFFPLRYAHGVMQYRLPRWMSPFTAPPHLIGHSGSTGSFAFRDFGTDVFIAGTVNQLKRPSRPFQLMTRALREL